MKILISPGYGAGWSSWNSGSVARHMLTYQPIIDFIENGGVFKDSETRVDWVNDKREDRNLHPLLKQLWDECEEKFGETYLCILGADDLVVAEASGSFKIHEYDGFETIQYRDEEDWYEG